MGRNVSEISVAIVAQQLRTHPRDIMLRSEHMTVCHEQVKDSVPIIVKRDRPKAQRVVGVASDLGAAAQYLESMFSGLGDETEIIDNNNGVTLRQTGLRIVRSLENVIYY